ncbi:hypothetical protein LTR99_007375 [Exophiala xenobiotica]|uniref:Glycosyl transferase family 25 domain-containing protein n=1 Tax=Vermiconidia calcicola TaxID=1690605 RepID=A0AAV9Q511_9PEZI|nr:hypothetical protein LTR96_008013 [Exophiala xenobiotica]KAK5534484.1 hypothetical protein LTR25_006516 [Vermiconidia calcicola]KAK5544634.1 hypothetical protein LTR23_004398 [Chaetothyriales sp. CCFEE 6169]KAK5299107.1 hypothetical protein LTR99_007375 [Exophiala xenobiotica]KAK5334793.1 hypothetical protein LTR98_009166 [Exophiala xenobiotica]
MGLYQLPSRVPWSATTAARRNIVLAVLLLTLLGLTFSFFHHDEFTGKFPSLSGRPTFGVSGKKDSRSDIYNGTLGFQQVYMINQPGRSDRRDTMMIQAQLTQFSMEVVDGVAGWEVPAKVLPWTMKQDNTTIGAWRSHLNVMNRIIQDNVQTALVLEDDSDWDVALKAQLAELARGARWLLDNGNSKPVSPYGDGWDILWIGHCSSSPDDKDGRFWVIPHDPTVAPQGDSKGPDMTRWVNGGDADLTQPRVIFKQQQGRCTSGYAVTRRAAQRILWHSSLTPNNRAIDGGMSDLCRGREFGDFTCIAPFPQLIGKSKPAGSKGEGSPAESKNVMFSVLQNVGRILDGESTFKSCFPNPSGHLLTMEQITDFHGYPDDIKHDAQKTSHR